MAASSGIMGIDKGILTNRANQRMEILDLLKYGSQQGASDLHLLPGLPPMLRVAGELAPIPDLPALTSEQTERIIYNVMGKEQQEAFEKHLSIDMAVTFQDIGHFRVSILHQLRGVAAVFRFVPVNVPTFEELNLPLVIKRLLSLSHGLVLVTGATGSGKSTTLAAMVDYINSNRSAHIITIEDPIEFTHTPKKSAINQLQVGRDTKDFATALRSSLRQDPDVIMLGEMRDLETIRLALTAAETGHLVLATLHASTSPLTISRIVDVFPSSEKKRVRNLLSETLQAVLCQKLVKRISGGRIAAFEIMLATPAIRHLIREDMISHMQSTIQTNGDIGMCTLEQNLQELVAKHLITHAVARSTVINSEGFQP